MTTVAANIDCMAADSFTTDGMQIEKIIQLPTMLIGFCGDAYFAQMLADWVIEGERGPCPPWDINFAEEGDRAYETELLILDKNGLYSMDGRGKRIRITGPYAAIGSGSAVALGAMYFGHSPSDAVAAACVHDSHTKAPIICRELPRTKRVVKKVSA